MASSSSSPNALKARWRSRDAAAERSCTSTGRTSVSSAATIITAATGTSHQAMKPKIATGATIATATCGRYWPKKLCSCSTPSTIDSMTPPVRSAPNQAGPSATILSNRRARRSSWICAAVRWATMVRACSSTQRSTTATPVAASGQTSVAAGSPWNTPARKLPRKAKRAIPNASASRPSSVDNRMRPTQPGGHAPEIQVEMHGAECGAGEAAASSPGNPGAAARDTGWVIRCLALTTPQWAGG